MRALRLAILVLLLTPALARASDVTMVVRDVPLDGGSRALSASTGRFDMAGLHWQGSGVPLLRARSLSGRWGPWLAADDDWGRDGSRWRKGAAEWTGPADAIQYRLRGQVSHLRAYLLWSSPEPQPVRRLALAGEPPIIPRLSWGADESIRRAPPVFADSIRFALVHHTVNTNGYTKAQSAAIVHGIEVYHVKGNGWNDIGYNFLVDRFGQVFEGRYGGVERNTVGAHSQGFNTGSVGVAVIGTFASAGITQAARDALVKLLSWRLDVSHVDPLSFVNVLSGGNTKYPAGIPVDLRVISGHRDTYLTDCPGGALYADLPSIAHAVAASGGPKLYAPAVAGKLGGAIRFTGRLSTALPWTVSITDATGAVVASGSGKGTAIDWTWDSTLAPAGRYAWTIGAGSTVRPATGSLGGKAGVALALTDLAASPPAISPNGDGVDDSTTISYSLTQTATVTATLIKPDGSTLATLFSDIKAPGSQSFRFSADGIDDGRYTIALAATGPDGKQVLANVTVAVDRTLSALTVTPALFSPNGDGRLDTLTVSFTLAAAVPVRVRIVDASGNPVTVLASGPLEPGPQTFSWDGSKRVGRLLDGVYAAEVELEQPAGAIDHSFSFVSDTHAPKLVRLSPKSLSFRLSEDATVTLTVGARSYVRRAKAGIVSFWLKSVPKRFSLVVEDAAGNRSSLP